MKRNSLLPTGIVLLLLCLSLPSTLLAGTTEKVFWSENFSGGKLPESWKMVDVQKKGCEWAVTDQPFPGSWRYSQQAPPIASTSRGFHLQYAPGYIVDDGAPGWKKKDQYPDCYVVTAPINCTGHKSVSLKFEQTFRWMNYATTADAGLYVGISTDGLIWKDINIRGNHQAAKDMFIPIREVLDISSIASNQPQVYLRFFWKGMYGWYWMIDDIALFEPAETDLAISGLTSHGESGNVFTQNDNFVLKVKNIGARTVDKDFESYLSLNGQKPVKVNFPASKTPILPYSEAEIKFPSCDLTQLSSHKVSFWINLEDDRNKSNDSLKMKIVASKIKPGQITGFNANDSEFDITCGLTKAKVIFYSNDIFRIWITPDGEFTNPAANDIVVDYTKHTPKVAHADNGTYYSITTPECVLRVYKNPLKFALYNSANNVAVFEESESIMLGDSTVQHLVRQKNEYFYGGGMQNGYFSHRDTKIKIEVGGGWNNGGRPNPAPFYMSTSGYGAFRNTFKPGFYDFTEKMQLTHNENRFDCYYFVGPSLKKILDGYTRITGRPFLMARWQMMPGDANCYNRGAKGNQTKNYTGTGTKGTTPDVISLIGDKYVENKMPRGWILPNDGYGCGYTRLDSVVSELAKRGLHTGLWTENGVDKIAKEVGVFGTRICKLDVAWVGAGYKFALDGCRTAYQGIENNCNERGFVWSVMGWAGTQRYSTVWTGDQKGDWEYIRFHIPTVIGSGLSAQNAATGDIDGIFGGSDKTYVRDLQWKCFTPVLMSMSGWAKKDKQPWVFGEPFTSINRNYLTLKMRMMPYMYTYCNESYTTGVPTCRAMVLEYPDDPVAKGKLTQYQFLNGESLLVAPVFKDEAKRDSIYFPKGRWIDYWNGDSYDGNQWLSNYPAPLEKLPLFVKEGAIIPMYPAMMYDRERPADTLTIDLYPFGKSSFNLYEDDGFTRKHREGQFATTLIEMNRAEKMTTLNIGEARGNYDGKYAQRVYLIDIHRNTTPRSIKSNQKALKSFSTKTDFDKAEKGWYFDPNDRKGIVHIKTGWLPTDKKSVLTWN